MGTRKSRIRPVKEAWNAMPGTSFFEKVEGIPMNRRILIFVGTLLVLVGLFIWIVYIPKTAEISRITEEIAGFEQRINVASARKKNLARHEAEQAQLDAQFNQLLKLLPDQREIPGLLRSITHLEKDSNIEFLLFKLKEERTKDFFVEIPVSMEISGKYHDIALFFDKVGQMDRIVNISDVSMRPISTYSTNLITKCEAVTFRFKVKSDEKAEKSKKK